jgi:signal transduction histidine kinase
MAISTSAMAMRRHPERQQDVQRCAEHIENAVKRGAAIAGGVMRFVRPATPVRQTIDARTWLHSLVNEIRVLLLMRPGAPDIVVAPAAGEPPLVSADPLELHQVFSNLVLNAAEAMAEGGTIEVSVEGNEGCVHWRVKDTGTGIPAAVVDRIFEPLFTTKPRGNGLGLAIVQQIVSMHGGHLSVESAPGAGTTVHVFLPAACA